MAQMMRDNQRIMELFASKLTSTGTSRVYTPKDATPSSVLPIMEMGVTEDGRGRGRVVNVASSSDSNRQYGPVCYNCGKRGHYRNECTSPDTRNTRVP